MHIIWVVLFILQQMTPGYTKRNDLPNVCKVTMPFLFADDTKLFTSGDDLDVLYDTANHELNNIAEWLKVNKLSLNVKKHIIYGIFR